jgi:DNA (cytosine-5)-methyltransferase 1
MRELALFAGTGGGILGGHLLGWQCVCAVEKDPFARLLLNQRQIDGHLPPFPIHEDVTTFDGNQWRGKVDIISGGFPCQDISEAGQINGKREGIDGIRSGLVREMLRIIGEVRPHYVIAENSKRLRKRGLAFILSELAGMGYDARWGVIAASDAGGNHNRPRMWIVANDPGQRSPLPQEVSELARRGHRQPDECRPRPVRPDWWSAEPGLARMDDGSTHRVDRTRCIGNGQVPGVVPLAWHHLGPH